ncbi:MAG: YihY/virulence factor BrkB family protein [Vicinamibacterales bacterium]
MLERLKVPLSWKEILKRSAKEFVSDNAFDLGAQQAYYFFFALFPALLTLLSIASFFTLTDQINDVVNGLGSFVPPDVLKIVADQILKISDSQQGGLLTVGFLLTLWSSSGALVSIITTLNAAYDVTEGRPWWKVRLTAIGLTVGTAVFILLSLFLVLVGPTLAEHLAVSLRLGPAFKWTWWVLQWPVVLALVATGIGLIYYFAPDVQQEWMWITPGSIVATLLWLAVSLAFKVYLTYFGDYNQTYGTIGAVIVLLTWLYISGLAIIFGAEMNSEIEHASPEGKAIGEKVAGEKRLVGRAARQHAAKLKEKGDVPVLPFPDHVNCDIDAEQDAPRTLRPSEALIAAALLMPAAIAAGREIVKSVRELHHDQPGDHQRHSS